MTYQQVRQCLQDVGIVYARSLSGDNTLFRMPEDWYAWNPSAHHANPNVVSYAEEFVAIDFSKLSSAWRYPRLFYLWGHSFEFESDDNWHVIEEFFQKVANRDTVWYATNIEIYDYVAAYAQLIWNADCTAVHNPTATDVWFLAGKQIYGVKAGQTLTL